METNKKVPNVFFKRYPQGKYVVMSDGDPSFSEVVKKALDDSIYVFVEFNQAKFYASMQQNGVPKSVADEYLKNLSIGDHTYVFEHSTF